MIAENYMKVRYLIMPTLNIWQDYIDNLFSMLFTSICFVFILTNNGDDDDHYNGYQDRPHLKERKVEK